MCYFKRRTQSRRVNTPSFGAFGDAALIFKLPPAQMCRKLCNLMQEPGGGWIAGWSLSLSGRGCGAPHGRQIGAGVGAKNRCVVTRPLNGRSSRWLQTTVQQWMTGSQLFVSLYSWWGGHNRHLFRPELQWCTRIFRSVRDLNQLSSKKKGKLDPCFLNKWFYRMGIQNI